MVDIQGDLTAFETLLPKHSTGVYKVQGATTVTEVVVIELDVHWSFTTVVSESDFLLIMPSAVKVIEISAF